MTELNLNIGLILSSIISLLFSIIAFFIRQLYNEFRKMEINLAEIRTSTEVIKANMNSESIRTSDRIYGLEKRTEKLEYQLMPGHDGKRDP